MRRGIYSICIGILALLPAGCSWFDVENSTHKQYSSPMQEGVIPRVLPLDGKKRSESTMAQPIGYAIPLDVGMVAAPDHMLQQFAHIVWEGKTAAVARRDFSRDMALLRIGGWDGVYPRLSDVPPAVGQELFWLSGGEKKSGEVTGLDQSFHVAENEKTHLIAVSGLVEPGDSGGALFDARGVIYGMIIGVDRTTKTLYAVRSDILLDFYRDLREDVGQ